MHVQALLCGQNWNPDSSVPLSDASRMVFAVECRGVQVEMCGSETPASSCAETAARPAVQLCDACVSHLESAL